MTTIEIPKLIPKYKVSLIAENSQHKYTVNDEPTFLPGVTGILDELAKHALLPWTAKEVAEYMRIRAEQWISHGYRCKKNHNQVRFFDVLVKRAKKQARFIKESAAVKGSAAHKIFDEIIKQGFTKASESKLVESFNFWIHEEPIKIIQGDTCVASIKFGYGGSLDALGWENGKIVIIDFKTGRQIYDSHAYQVASYSYAMKETYGLDYYPEAYIIRFDQKKVRYERRHIANVHDSFKCFQDALDIYNHRQLSQFDFKETFTKDK